MADTYVGTVAASEQITSLMRRVNALEAGLSLSVGTKALLWLTNCDASMTPAVFANLTTYYTGTVGITIDNNTTWSGDIDDYGLVIFPLATSNPSWLSSITVGSWSGLFVVTADRNLFGSSISYVHGLRTYTGISVTSADIDAGSFVAGSAESNTLNTGVSNIYYNATSSVSGGTTLSKTLTGSVPWLSTSQTGNVIYVVSGDSSFLTGPSVSCPNSTLYSNFWTYKPSSSYTQTSFNSYTTTTATSLGTPDGGVSVPDLNALNANGAGPIPRHIVDMRDAIETLAPYFTNPATATAYNWNSSDPNNLYYVAVERTQYGASNARAYDWTRTEAQMEGTFAYSLDIAEVADCITQLEAS